MFEFVGLRSTRGKAVIVAAVVALLSTVTAMPASADGSQGRDADVEVDTAAAKVPVSGIGRLAIKACANSKGVDIHSWGVVPVMAIWCSGY